MMRELVSGMFQSSLMQDILVSIKGFGHDQLRHTLSDVEEKAQNLERSFEEARRKLDKLDGQKLVDDQTLRSWARDVMCAMYDLDDLTSDVSLKIQEGNNGVLSLLKNWSLSRDIDHLQNTINTLLSQASQLLFPSDSSNNSLNASSSHPVLLPPKLTISRKRNMEEIIQKLQITPTTNATDSSQAVGNGIVISIQGVLGLGKTTLACWVMNDARIKYQFDYRFWVSVSGNFNLAKVMHSIITQASIQDQHFVTDHEDLINMAFRNQRVLIILDDVCKVGNPEEWKRFIDMLHSSSLNFGVLITTRNHQLTSTIDYRSLVPVFEQRLKLMSNEECQAIILTRTFCSSLSLPSIPNKRKMECQTDESFDVAEKFCNGSPLLACIIGLHLSNTETDRWYNLLSATDLWDMPGFGRHIIPTFRLDFSLLPRGLRNCFYYLSLFPIDFKFNKQDLVRYWNAEGFTMQGTSQNFYFQMILEQDMGHDWFDELSSRSILIYDPEQHVYRMHETIHRYAKYISCGLCFHLDKSPPYDHCLPSKDSWVNKARHLALVAPNLEPSTLGEVEKCKGLHTLVSLSEQKTITKLSYRIFSRLQYLRVLNLSGTAISELPGSMGNLNHLRLLDLSGTDIQELPASTTKLHRLQILKLIGCCLIELPNNTQNLTNLLHLEADIKGMTCMPPFIGKLTNLRTLPAFIVNDKDGHRITELKDLKQLRGSICLTNLENIKSEDEAKAANLKDMQFIHRLELEWNNYLYDRSKAQNILSQFEPHKRLEELQIIGYGGHGFPKWLSSSECRLTSIHLLSCHNCSKLPSLAQLPYLKSLHIQEMPKIECIDDDFSGARVEKPFPSLESLIIEDMTCLEKWESMTMSHLRDLRVVGCSKLRSLPLLDELDSLAKMEISDCPGMHSLPEGRMPSSLELLIIEGCDLLKERCSGRTGADWTKIELVPKVLIDFEQVIPSTSIII